MRYSKGISWIDDVRIPFVENDKPTGGFGAARIGYGNEYDYDGKCNEANTQGRFPANILVCDDMLNDGKKHGNLFNTNRNKDVDGGTGNSLVRAHKQGESNGVFDNGISSSRFYDIDKWFNNLIDG